LKYSPALTLTKLKRFEIGSSVLKFGQTPKSVSKRYTQKTCLCSQLLHFVTVGFDPFSPNFLPLHINYLIGTRIALTARKLRYHWLFGISDPALNNYDSE
jgi:hypothetical protein